MLRLLLDEHISPAVAQQVRRQLDGAVVFSIHEWRSGALLGADDEKLLEQATNERFTLVTYDLKTIPAILAAWLEERTDYAGVIFVTPATIAANDIGGLVRAIMAVYRSERDADWTNRVMFLKRAGK